MKRIMLGAIAALQFTACAGGRDQAAETGADTLVAVVDSARSPAEELNRFRAELAPDRPDSLRHGAPSAEQLARSFLAALERNDTTALPPLLIDAAEFAYFYYPYTSYNHPPHQQAAGFVWMQLQQNSEKGIRRALQRWGGRPLALESLACARREPQDLNVLHGECKVTVAGDTVARVLFGTILERAGRFKFLSYANDL